MVDEDDADSTTHERTLPLSDVDLLEDSVDDSKEEVFSQGMTLGNVELVKLIAEGGMGGVWVAEHRILGKQVAVKVVSAHLLRRKPALVKRIQREAEALAKLDHEHIVRIYDYGQTDQGTPYLIMELLHGMTLARALKKKKRFPLPVVVELVDQIASALTAAHDLGIVHRDIKPGNIFMCETDDGAPMRVKVLDFGIAKQIGLTSGITSVTATGVMLGTPHFMSPEQLLEPKNVDARTDLWSLGVVAFSALTGKLPFKGETLAQLFGAITTGAIKRPSDVIEGLPKGIDRWFAKALHREAAQRFASAREMSDKLAELAQEPPRRDPPPPQAPKPAESEPPRRRKDKLLPYPFALMDGTDDTAVAKREAAKPRVVSVQLTTTQRLGIALAVVVAVAVAIVLVTRPNTPSHPTPKLPGAKMVRIPAGVVEMGCSESSACQSDERPAHQVALEAFELDQTEVTVAMYRACVDAGACTANHSGMSTACSWGRGGGDDLPMNCVAWSEAEDFCAFASKRLPTEAEWERAARGNDARTYPWGNQPATCDLAVLNEASGSCRIGAPIDVGSRPEGRSPYEAHDMAGNVAEWVADWYAEDYYPRSEREGPRGPDAGSERVVRGGGWLSGNAESARAARRHHSAPTSAAPDVGFRCARDAP